MHDGDVRCLAGGQAGGKSLIVLTPADDHRLDMLIGVLGVPGVRDHLDDAALASTLTDLGDTFVLISAFTKEPREYDRDRPLRRRLRRNFFLYLYDNRFLNNLFDDLGFALNHDGLFDDLFDNLWLTGSSEDACAS